MKHLLILLAVLAAMPARADWLFGLTNDVNGVKRRTYWNHPDGLWFWSGTNQSTSEGHWVAFTSSTNIAGHAGLTNATRLGVFGMRDVFTNKFRTLEAGANITLENQGTNILISAAVGTSLTNGLATISFVTNFYRAGSIGMTKPELVKAVTFTGNLADTNYAVFLSASTNTVLWYSNKTVSGFTLRVTVGLTGRVDYIAIPQR